MHDPLIPTNEAPSSSTAPSSLLLDALNPAQREAVSTTEGPLLVLAGAGTGKTRVLTSRLAYLLESGRVYPSQILAVTFTNKAAMEMRERVSELLGGAPVEGWWLGTFHALAARQLRRHADLVGLSSNFTILDPDDQVRLLKQLMEVNGIDIKKWVPKAMMSFIDRWKDRGLTPLMVDANDAGDLAGGKLLTLYKLYQARMREVNACDFGDLLLHMITILRDPTNAEVLAEYHKRFRYILVDEYQDTNVAQYLWLRLLAQGTGEGSVNNICCVGDDDQSIYGWRGAEVDNILRFEKDFPGGKTICLEQNYRSTNNILKAAGAVIANNGDRLGKELWSQAGDGDKVAVCGLWDGKAEARWVGEEIEQLQHARGMEAGYNLSQIAVLIRAGFQTREFEERFIKLGIAYKVIGGARFYERMEIRDALAYLRVIAQPADDLALERIINKPKRAIGPSTVQKLYEHGREHGMCLHDAIIDLTQRSALKPKVNTTLMKLLDNFARWRSLIDNTPHAEIAALTLEESGYMQMWKEDKTPEAPGRVENLKEFVSGMQEFDSLAEFLEHVALVFENQDNANGDFVSIMTLHGAKGLEFDAVFLTGWEEGLFPSQRTMNENGIKGLEEERRLAYVGITRAKKRCFITFAAQRYMYGRVEGAIPSRFVDELPQENVEVTSQSGLGGVGRSTHWDSSGFQPNAYREDERMSQQAFSETGGRFGKESGGSVSGWSVKNQGFDQTRAAAAKARHAAQSHDRKVINEEGVVFARGDKVAHAKFGNGMIINIDGHKLDIAFEDGSKKRVMDNFVEKL